MNTIADRLKAAREDAGLTQPELAAKAHVSQGTIGNIETGLRKRPRELLSIAQALGVSPAWLESGKGPKLSSDTAAPTKTAQPISLENNPDYPAVRHVKFKLSAGASGFGVEYQDDEGVPIVFQRAWFERNGFRPEVVRVHDFRDAASVHGWILRPGQRVTRTEKGAAMTTTPPRLQYTSIRTRVVDGKPLIGLKHTAKGADGAQIKYERIEMPPEDVRGLIKTLQEVLDELGGSA